MTDQISDAELAVQGRLPEIIQGRAIDVVDALLHDERTRDLPVFEVMLLAYWQGRIDERKD